MSVVLRHKMFPLMVAFKDPEKSWNESAKDRLIEEIKKDGFDNFTVIDWEKAMMFVGQRVEEKSDNKIEKEIK